MSRVPVVLMAVLMTISTARGAPGQAAPAGAPSDEKAAKRSHFFDSEEPLQLTLTANLKQLKRDRDPKSPYRAATLAYAGPDSAPVKLPLRVRTRGIWRLKNCDFPPIRFHFAKEDVKHSIFARESKQKLVTYCRDNDEYERNLLMEYQLYRIYNLLTPIGPRARLAKITFVDSATGKTAATRYGFLLEDIAEYAERNGARQVAEKGATPDDLEPNQSALFGVWQYFIGNTDFSISMLHNVALIQNDTSVYPVPYDYDWTGVVNPRYAFPDSRLPIRTVRQRLMRGYCVPAEFYQKAFALFNQKKSAIYALYSDPIGKLLPPDKVKDTLEYFDEFYKVINNRGDAKGEIIEACQGKR